MTLYDAIVFQSAEQLDQSWLGCNTADLVKRTQFDPDEFWSRQLGS